MIAYFGYGVMKAFAVVADRPLLPTFVDIAPMKAIRAIGRMAEIIYFKTSLTKTRYDFGLKGISPR